MAKRRKIFNISQLPEEIVLENRAIITNNGITGGGDLSIDRTFSLTGQALSFHNLSTNGYIVRIGTDNIVTREIIGSDGITVINGDGISGNTIISLNSLSLSDLSNVILTTPTLAQLLGYDGTNWVNVNPYIHPTQSSIDTGILTGATVVSRIQVNTLGHTTLISTRNLTTSDIGAQPLIVGTQTEGYIPTIVGGTPTWSEFNQDNFVRVLEVTGVDFNQPLEPQIVTFFNSLNPNYVIDDLDSKLNFVLTEEVTSTIQCGTSISYPGGFSYPTIQDIYLGEGTGTVTLIYNAQTVPDRYIVRYDNTIVIDTGYVGGADYDFGGVSRSTFITALNGEIDPVTGNVYPDTSTYPDDGYPRIVGVGSGSANFIKSTDNTLARVEVYAPISGTAWSFSLSCPDGVAPDPKIYRIIYELIDAGKHIYGLNATQITTANLLKIEDNRGEITENEVKSLIQFNLSGYVPKTTTLTINGISQNLFDNRTWNLSLNDISNVVLTSPASGQILSYNGTNWVNASIPGGGGGTVTEINTGVGLTGGPITTTGTISLTGQALSFHSVTGDGFVYRTSGLVGTRLLVASTGILISNGDGISGNPTITNTDRGSSQNIFKNIAVSGQSTIVADNNNDTLTLVAGSNVTITTNVTSDSITISSTDTNTTYTAGSGLSLVGTQFSHLDTSSQGSVDNSGGTVIQDITLDTYGHITGLESINLDTRYYTKAEIGNFFSGAISITGYNKSNWDTAFSWGNHASAGYLTSLAHNHGIANSAGTQQFTFGVNENVRFAGSGATSISFDSGTKTVTISSTDTNTTYTAGTGLSLAGTTFSLNLGYTDGRYVTIETTQTITGAKTFANKILMNTDVNNSHSTILNSIQLYKAANGSVITMTSNTKTSTTTILRSYAVSGVQMELQEGGLKINGDLNISDSALITNDNSGGTTNIDHLWHNDLNYAGFGGVWHFVSDSTYKATGNSAVNAGGFFENGIRVVNSNRTITAGTGLTGGGDLSSNRTISFDTSWGDNRYISITEGSYTPLLRGTVSNPTYTPSTPIGKWTRFGNLIRIFVRIGWTSYTGGSGDLYITLPSLLSGEDYDYDFHGSISYAGGTWSTNPATIVVDGFTGQQSGVIIRASLNNTNDRPIFTVGSLSSSGVIEFQILARIISAPV